jgi:hypothetical protein
MIEPCRALIQITNSMGYASGQAAQLDAMRTRLSMVLSDP